MGSLCTCAPDARRGATGGHRGALASPPRRGTLAPPRRGILVFFVGDGHWPYDNISQHINRESDAFEHLMLRNLCKETRKA